MRSTVARGCMKHVNTQPPDYPTTPYRRRQRHRSRGHPPPEPSPQRTLGLVVARIDPFSTWSPQLVLGRRLKMGSRDHRVGNEDLDQVATEGQPAFPTSVIALAVNRSTTKIRPVTTSSRAIDAAVALAIAGGNAVRTVSTGWVRARQVVHITRPTSAALYAAITADTALCSWSVDATPHHPAERVFTNNGKDIALSSRLPTMRRRPTNAQRPIRRFAS